VHEEPRPTHVIKCGNRRSRKCSGEKRRTKKERSGGSAARACPELLPVGSSWTSGPNNPPPDRLTETSVICCTVRCTGVTSSDYKSKVSVTERRLTTLHCHNRHPAQRTCVCLCSCGFLNMYARVWVLSPPSYTLWRSQVLIM